MRQIIALTKLTAFAVVTLAIIPFQFLVMLFSRGKASYALPCLWHKIVCKIFGIKVRPCGKYSKAPGCQTIFVSNHLSYLDIPVMGSLLKASFVAKKEVKSWPVFGFLSKLQQTAYISRARSDSVKSKDNLSNMLNQGKNLILFPEGTSTDGVSVLPFKSSLFSIALQQDDGNNDIYIQPVTIILDKVSGKAPQTQKERDIYAWHINMDTPLANHLWNFAKNKGASINLVFHDFICAKEQNNRKELAKLCHEAVSNGLTKTINQSNK